MYPQTKNELSMSRLSKVIVLQTDRHTHRHCIFFTTGLFFRTKWASISLHWVTSTLSPLTVKCFKFAVMTSHNFTSAETPATTQTASEQFVSPYRLIRYPLPVKPIFRRHIFAGGGSKTTETDDAHATTTEWHPASGTLIPRHHLSLDSHQTIISGKHAHHGKYRNDTSTYFRHS